MECRVKMPATNKLTVVLRDDGPMHYCQDPPIHRTVQITLTDEQMGKLALHMTHQSGGQLFYESISSCFIEPM